MHLALACTHFKYYLLFDYQPDSNLCPGGCSQALTPTANTCESRSANADKHRAAQYHVLSLIVICVLVAAAKLSPPQLAHVKGEIEMLTRLQHEGIARCRGSWQDERHLYCVEEYGIRGDLFTEMFSERYSCTPWGSCTAACRRAVAQLHGAGQLHTC